MKRRSLSLGLVWVIAIFALEASAAPNSDNKQPNAAAPTKKPWTVFGHEPSLSGTNAFNYTYHFDNADGEDGNDKYHQLINTLDIDLAIGDARFGARFDLHLFIDTPLDRCPTANPPTYCFRDKDRRYLDSYMIYRDGVRLPERLYFVLAKPAYDLTLGDFYVSFGKGIALNVTKIDALGQDTTIRGGKFSLHHGDVGFTFVAGEFNPLDTDASTGRPALWGTEPVIGGRLEYRGLGGIILAAHGVWIHAENPPPTGGISQVAAEQHTVFGGGIEAPSLLDDRLSFAFEIDFQRTPMTDGSVFRGPGVSGTERQDTFDGPTGLASYLTSTLAIGNSNLVGEFKYYNDFQLAAREVVDQPYILLYNMPPTLERIEAEVSDNVSTVGGRLRYEYNWGARGPVELVTFASYGYFQTRFALDGRVHDPYLGAELTWQDGDGQLDFRAGARYERDAHSDELAKLDIHFSGNIEQRILSTHSVKLTWLYQSRFKRLLTLERHDELDTALTYKWSPYLSAAMTIEYSNDSQSKLYLAGALRYFFNASSYVGVRVGENRPGLKCYNGLCQFLPAFAGAELTAVARF